MHPDMMPREWHDFFTAAWDRLQQDIQNHRPLPLDDYAITNPAEIFAVCSEPFFEQSESMKYTRQRFFGCCVSSIGSSQQR
jgi:Mlc titration factor MtfA (ptsG expression regulator)